MEPGTPAAFFNHFRGNNYKVPAVKNRFENFKVVRNGNDIVTHVPPVLFGFRHITPMIKVGKGESEGLIDDHRPNNYLKNLKGVDQY